MHNVLEVGSTAIIIGCYYIDKYFYNSMLVVVVVIKYQSYLLHTRALG
jgi:hypothetical protein